MIRLMMRMEDMVWSGSPDHWVRIALPLALYWVPF